MRVWCNGRHNALRTHTTEGSSPFTRTKSMIGYHYTTREHWEEIKKEGLKPTLVKNVEIYNAIPNKIRPQQIFGIWVWKNKQDGLSHFGNLIRVALVHGSTNVTVISVEYKKEDLYTTAYHQGLNISHHGEIQNLEYHKDELADVLCNTIPMSQIRLQKHYDLVKMANG